jgi:hypothetical protein
VVDVLEGGSQGETLPPLDVWLRELQRQYPEQRVTIGHLTESAFHQQFLEDPRPADVVWRDMLEGLTSQKGGYEWRVKGMVPSLEKWLREGRWRQRHDEAPVSAVVSEKTSRTLTAAAEFIKGGRS